MNGRIKQLAAEVGISVEYLNNTKQWVLIEALAERIVGECMRMCDVAAVGYETHGHTKEANGCYSAKEYIAEHWGLDGMSTEDKKTLIKELLGVKND